MRVIAGRFRRRVLSAPRGLRTRPTTDRVREALFQILGPIAGERVVDFYAGTGALGIEALSRGAAHATFVETDRAALRALQKNLQSLALSEMSTVIPCDVARSRSRLESGAPYDLVLADPPWKDAAPAAVRVASTVRGLLAPGARVVLGHPADQPIGLPPELGLECVARRRWGGSGLSFFEMAE